MVLGLGSRSKKDRPSAVSLLVELDLYLHEIKPWQGLARPSNTPLTVSLRSSRGERVLGSSRNITPTLASGAEIGKIVVGEALRVLIAPNREILKRAKKSYPDLDNPLMFTLLEGSDAKGKPLGQAALELAALGSLTESKLIAVPFSVSKKVAKGPMPYLHLTVQRHQEERASGLSASASSVPSVSSRTSDASSVPPLDEDTQQMLVAALLSDEEDKSDKKEEEIDSFTDDEEDYKDDNRVTKLDRPSSLSQQNIVSKAAQEPISKAAKEPSLSQGNVINKAPLLQGNTIVQSVTPITSNMHERPSNLAVQQKIERQQSEKVDGNIPKQVQKFEESSFRQAIASPQVIASPQASPVKAAAIAAANAYAKKHSFLGRDTTSYMDDSDDPYSDLESDGEHEFPSRLSQAVRSPGFLPKGPQTAGRSSFTSVSMKSLDSVSNVPVNKNITTASQIVVKPEEEKIVDNFSQKSDNTRTELNGQHKSFSTSVVSTAANVKAVGGVGEVPEERADLNVLVSSITTENGKTLSLTKRTSGSSAEARLVPETTRTGKASRDSSSFGPTFVPEKTGNGKTSGDNIVSPQITEAAKSIPAVNSIGETAMKNQAKTKSGVKSPLREKSSSGPPKITVSRSPDPVKGRTSQSPIKDAKLSRTSSQEEKSKASKSLDRDVEKGDKKASEESRQRMPHVDSKAGAAEMRIQHLEAEVENLKGELREVAAVEAALYSTTAEHGSSSMKLHAPARRLARLYVHAYKNWSQERRASCARNTMSGLILVAKACGNDVPRLTFWWSNTTVLREIIATASSVLPASPNMGTMTHSSSVSERRSSVNGKKLYQKHQTESPSRDFEDWREPSTFTSALERLESWIFTKVVESIWWQVLTPQMQQPIKTISSDVDENDFDARQDGVKHDKKVGNSEIEETRQGNISVEIWKKAFLDAFERLCPVRRLGVECGCLPMLNKLVLEACVIRLDVAMFNAILRDDEIPTDPVSDPISDIRVLPISNSSLSFGLGAQLKNAVATLSSFLSNLASKDGENFSSVGGLEDDGTNVIMFPLLKAMGGLLMLPKDMLIDTSLRKEVCPTLDLPFIERILSKFQPDEFSPEPVTPELLQTINAEIAAENQKQDMEDTVTLFKIASAPSVSYCPPPPSSVKHWIGDIAGTNNQLGRSNSSVLRKGHTSDDELDEMESPISWLLVNTMGFAGSHGNDSFKRGGANSPKDVGGMNRRFMLLREVWNSG